MQLQMKQDPTGAPPKELMILDNPEIAQNRETERMNLVSGVVPPPLLVGYHIRPPLQDRTNEDSQQTEKAKVGSSVTGKGQWKRQARMQGDDLNENKRHENSVVEEGKRKRICLMPGVQLDS